MRVRMLQTNGTFEAGRVYDVPDTLAGDFVRLGIADKKGCGERCKCDIAAKAMKPGQVLKGGLDGH